MGGHARTIAVSVVPLPIVFQNSHVVVVDKPVGWLSVPSHAGVADPRPVIGLTLQAQLSCRLWPVHRLDEDVSGLLLFARNAEAHRRLCAAFEQHRIEKTYHARCLGPIPSDARLGQWVRWTTTLLRGKKRAYVHPAGKAAVTDALLSTLNADELHFLLRPRTGRGHQLRVELARRGCPIIGDKLYGSAAETGLPGIALRAFLLDFSQSEDAKHLHLPPHLFLPLPPGIDPAFATMPTTAGDSRSTVDPCLSVKPG
jgi:tRNA pseudouridine32 synthase/23S rRNA pseudouridine746 synthase